MGLFEAASALVGIEYKAKADQAIGETRRLAGEQKKAAREAAEGLKSTAEAHEKMVTRVTAAIGVAVAAYAVARSGLKAYEEQTRLVGATAGVQIEALRKASGGLKTDLELLQVAADGMNGRFKLTQAEIEQVLIGMRALTKEGREQEVVAKAVGDAIRKGEVEPLKELGVAFDEATAKTDKKKALLDALGESAKRAGGNLSMASDDSKRMGVSFENATNRIRAAIGQVVNAAAPAAEAFARMANELGRIAGGVAAVVEQAKRIPGVRGGLLGDIWDAGVWYNENWTPWGMGFNAGMGAKNWLFPSGGDESIDPEIANAVLMRYADTSTPGAAYLSPEQRRHAMDYLEIALARADSALRRGNRKAERVRRRARRGRGTATPRPQIDIAALGNQALDFLGSGYDAINQGLEDFGQMGTEWHPEEMDVLVDRSKAAAADLAAYMDQLKAQQRETFLTSVFGPIEQFNAYGSAFGTLKTAAQAAMQAWIDGSMSAGAAFKQAMAQQLGAQAVELLGLGITSGAWGFYHLATGNPKGAGELAASGKAFAGAALVGSLARALGGGGVPSVGAAAAGVGPRGGGGSGGEGSVTNIHFGDSLGWESPRTQAIRWRQIERLAQNRLPPPAGVGD